MWRSVTCYLTHLLFYCLHVQGQGCGGNLNGPSGFFYSEDYSDTGTYPSLDRSCFWTVTVDDTADGDPGTAMLRFTDFLVEPKWLYDNYYCHYDYVHVSDGPVATKENSTNRYCGGSLPGMFRATGNALTVHFRTDNLDNFRGFVAAYGNSRERVSELRRCSVDDNSELTMFSGETGHVLLPCTYVLANLQCAQYTVIVNVTNEADGKRKEMKFSPLAVHVHITTPWSELTGVVTESRLKEAAKFADISPWKTLKNTGASIHTFFDPSREMAVLQHRRKDMDGKLKELTPDDLVLEVTVSRGTGVEVKCDALLSSSPYPESMCGSGDIVEEDEQGDDEGRKNKDRSNEKDKEKPKKRKKKKNKDKTKRDKEGKKRKRSKREATTAGDQQHVLKARTKELGLNSEKMAVIFDLLDMGLDNSPNNAKCLSMAEKFEECHENKVHAIRACGPLFGNLQLAACVQGDPPWFVTCLEAACDANLNSCEQLKERLAKPPPGCNLRELVAEKFHELDELIKSC